MAQIWLLEIAKAIGKFFIHPVFYFSIILALAAGFWRVKRERNDFHVRVHGLLHELKLLWPAGILAGVVLSIFALSLGVAIPLEFLIVAAAFSVLLGVIGNARLLSPAFTVGLPIIFIYITVSLGLPLPYSDQIRESMPFLAGISVLLAMLMLSEGILILKDGLKDVSPKLRTSRRGLTVGAHQMKRFWLLPVFLVFPAGPFTSAFDWWPVIHWGGESYSLILVPFLLGFQQQIQSCLPKAAAARLGKQVTILGIVVLAASSLVFFYPVFAPPVVAGVSILGRLWISYRHRVRENNTLYYYTPLNDGIIILDVIPGSPAERMELKTGEMIKMCNNIKVSNKKELYNALLKNRAYCKLEVLDTNREIRFVQCSLYEGDHHELGILFVEKRTKPQGTKAV
ncbi:PDZ domain-containing protein [Siminovitchia sp. 179-K 8D1 HS]|uniref:PDZ domain-containing protein n=1 Tax=Siminovitchia sp. 179-K 8D1 HS TaxID=3142385 RepID=UPI00399EF22F